MRFRRLRILNYETCEKLGGEMYKKADEYINEFVVEFLKIPLE